VKLEIGKTYQPRSSKEKPVKIIGTSTMHGIYKFQGEWKKGELPDHYSETGMIMHIESQFDLIEEIN